MTEQLGHEEEGKEGRRTRQQVGPLRQRERERGHGSRERGRQRLTGGALGSARRARTRAAGAEMLACWADRGREGADQAGLLARERGVLASAWELGRPEGRWAERGERKERVWASSRVGLISGFGLVLVFLFL